MQIAGAFDPPTVSDLAAVARQDVRGVTVVAGPADRFAPHVRVRWLRELLPGVPVEVRDEGAGPDEGAGQGEAAMPLSPAAAEAVKADPMGRWDEIPPPVRPAFVRRVRLFGAESSGKSTMAARLAERYATVWVPEQWRSLYVKHGHQWTPAHVLDVATAQLEAEEQAARHAHRVLLCDTDALMTLLYARTAFGEVPAWLQAYCDSPAYAARYAATLLFAPDLPWEPDPVREGPEARARYFRVFEDELAARRIPYTRVSGTGSAREGAAVDAVDAVLAAPVLAAPAPPLFPFPAR